MEAIEQLQEIYVLHKVGLHEPKVCIDWAIERLQLDQEENDLDIILLAAATKREEVLPLTRAVLEKYCNLSTLDEQLIIGKHIVELYQKYLSKSETIKSLDCKFTRLCNDLGYPNWLVMLSRNCEYATDIPAFQECFEQEFEYIASLWSFVSSFQEFEEKYSREVSNQHDLKRF
ncbi:MAG: hypothetical protein AAF215_12260 [Cyanobacteria bacterium P01_A01_bin.123]